MARVMVLAVPAGVVAVQVRRPSGAVAGCSGAVVLRVAAIPTQVMVEAVRSAAGALVRVAPHAGPVVVLTIGAPTFWNAWWRYKTGWSMSVPNSPLGKRTVT